MCMPPSTTTVLPATNELSELAAATSDPRGLNGGALALASFHLASITVSWLFLTAFLAACAVLSGLQLLLSRSSCGRKVRATSDDLDTARLVGIRVRPVFATVAGIAVATAALARSSPW
jgi:branched-chain amino acid transport system permease protein